MWKIGDRRAWYQIFIRGGFVVDNNKVLKKITIAMNLRNEDVREILHIGGQELSISQTGAVLVSEPNKNFKILSDELLEAFMEGLITYSRGPKNVPNLIPLALANLVYLLGERGNQEALEALGGLVEDVVTQLTEQLEES